MYKRQIPYSGFGGAGVEDIINFSSFFTHEVLSFSSPASPGLLSNPIGREFNSFEDAKIRKEAHLHHKIFYRK